MTSYVATSDNSHLVAAGVFDNEKACMDELRTKIGPESYAKPSKDFLPTLTGWCILANGFSAEMKPYKVP